MDERIPPQVRIPLPLMAEEGEPGELVLDKMAHGHLSDASRQLVGRGDAVPLLADIDVDNGLADSLQGASAPPMRACRASSPFALARSGQCLRTIAVRMPAGVL